MMIEIDGSMGEGGGQILRSCLSLAMVTGQGFRIRGIRAGRKKPGLLRQHLTCVQVAERMAAARVEGASLGSTELEFHPQGILAGEYHCAIGTAGSTSLVLQAVLPAMLVADGPSRLVVEGGTHNPWAPPFDFLAHSFLPLLARMGAEVKICLERPGFFPAGGGRIAVSVQPARDGLRPLNLCQRGELRRREAVAYLANLEVSIAERELQRVQRKLSFAPAELRIDRAQGAIGPGNMLSLVYEFAEVSEVFTGFGERGRRAEAVADGAIREAQAYLAQEAPVGTHLADQLILPMAMAGAGVIRAMPLSRHSSTNIAVVEQLLPVCFAQQQGPLGVELRVGPR